MTIKFSHDIGDYLEKGSQADHVKARFLESPNVPDNIFIYPFSIHNKLGKQEKRYLKKDHFMINGLYIPKKKVAFFVIIVFFFLQIKEEKIIGNVTLKSLVSVPLNKYAKILGETGDFSKHSKNLHHINATQAANAFLTCYKNPAKEIISVINSSRLKQVIENRARFKPIIESVIFLGRQNIPLRGHRDQGSLIGDEHSKNNSSVVNEGNFRELFKFFFLFNLFRFI